MTSQQDPGQTAAGKVSSPSLTAALEPARQNYRALLLANPNHFGNLQQSTFKPVQALSLDTSYEQLVCLGLDTDFDRLEAVIEIKLDSGYEGAICSAGSYEYVRFYADLRNDGVWVDLGTASANVHDIPGDKPLCYAVALDFTPFREICLSENVIPVRAILSWSVPPPANTPGFVPVWGNSLTVEVQIRPRPWLIVTELPEPANAAAAQLAAFALVDPAATLPLKPLATLSVAAKAALYKDQDVPAHRFAFAEAQALLGAPALPPDILAGGLSPLAALGLSAAQAAELAEQLPSVNGDTTYEELSCAGLRPDSDMLEGVLTIKRSAGYSGQLCTSGSREYVAFWMDFGAGFVYVGTGSVNVHDLSNVPAQGLQYAVFAKCDLSQWTVPCTTGPRIVPLRAILSWATPPPVGDPNYVPVWGNRVECNVQLRPGTPTGHQPLIETVGNVDVSDIDSGTGLATGPGVGASFTAYQSPFGGSIQITGRIGNPPAFSPTTKLRYRIEATPYGAGAWQPITTNQLTVSYSQMSSAGIPVQCDTLGDYVCPRILVPSNDGDGLGDGWYDYIEDFQSPTETWLVQDLLASWQTGTGQEGLWQLRMVVKDMSVPSGQRQAIYGPQIISVDVDNTPPTVALAITAATFNGQPIQAADCGQFPVGAKLSGTFAVSDPGTSSPDQHFGGFSFGLLPTGPADGAGVQPAAGSFPAIPTTGESGTWTLDTSAMQPCGFDMRLSAADRTIYDSGFVGLSNYADVGFCLLAPPKAG